MTMAPPSHRRGDVRQALQRDLARRGRRSGSREFWKHLALIGSVGWPVALLATGGALLGRALDMRWRTGLQFTLLFLMLGVTLGCVMAWRILREKT